jgi:hypothetical protein
MKSEREEPFGHYGEATEEEDLAQAPRCTPSLAALMRER